jgi:hypothetical protein
VDIPGGDEAVVESSGGRRPILYVRRGDSTLEFWIWAEGIASIDPESAEIEIATIAFQRL